MKWLIRIFVILVAALIVSGITAWVVPGVMPSRGLPNEEGRPGGFEQRQTPRDDNGVGQPPRRARGERGGSFFGMVVIMRSLLEIGIIVMPFAIYHSIKQRRKKAENTSLIKPTTS